MDFTQMSLATNSGRKLFMMLLNSIFLNQTTLVLLAFVILVFATLRRQSGSELFSVRDTNTLKALAIIVVIASHVRYVLVNDTHFLRPYSDFAGIAVDLFLLLSGYGLTYSWLKKPTTIGSFYKKRLLKIFLPLWLTLIIFVVLDYFIHHISYSPTTLASYAIGLVTSADIVHDFNSSLWFLAPLLAYYLLFPWIFKYSPKLLAPVVLAFAGWLVVRVDWNIHHRALELYRLHWLAFPIGCVGAIALTNHRVQTWFRSLMGNTPLRMAALAVMSIGLYIGYQFSFDIASLIQQQLVSITLAIGFGLAVCLIPFTSRGLEFIGVYSYEIYLVHWPLLYRYDPLYDALPLGLATIISVAVIVGLSILLQRGTKLITK
jgi:peptidoglycan/LPS O-acetylase OafA/YrhL